MKSFLLSFFMFFSGAAMAQSWSVLNDRFLELYNKEEFNKAAIAGEKAKLAAKKEFGEGHVNYATSLYNLASVYLEMSQYKKAEPLYLQAKAIQQKVLGENHADYASTISDLATLYTETKQYNKAEPLYLQAKKISASTNGISNAEYITIVDNLAYLYEDMKLYDKAEPLFLEANIFYKNQPGENKADYQSSLNSLAGLYDKMGKYANAQTYYWLLAKLLKQERGEVSKEYAKVINRIALIYTEMGEYEKAEPLYFDNAAIRKIVYGETHPDYASALNNIAAHYIDLGQYEKAMPFYLDAIAIAEQNPDRTNTDYVTYVNNIALLYMQMGKYDFAEPLFVRLVEVKKKIVGENDPSYAVSLNNLGAIYFKTGQFEKAIPVYTQALAVIKKSIGELTPDYASTLNNLALLYATMGQLSRAESLYLQSKTIREKLQLQDHPDYAALADNLGLLYSAIGQPARTKALYIQAKNIRRKLFGEQHPDYAVSLNNLGYYYMDEKQYDSAEVLFIQAKDILKKTLGERHPAYGTALNNLSDLYIKTGQYQKAEPGLLQSGNIVLEQLRTTFTVLSESEKNNFLKNNKAFFETGNNFLFRYKHASTETRVSIFNCQLVLKSASLADTKNMMSLLLNSPDSSIRILFSAWTANRNILAKQYALPQASRRNDLKIIESNTETQEKELNRLSSEFQSQQTALQVVMADVQKNLQPEEAAIEFVRFPVAGTDSILYAAYILHPEATVPDFIPLCEEKQLQQLFDLAGKTSASIVNSFYRGLDINSKIAGAAGKELYALIWQPLTPYLKGVRKISYAPAGKLYNIAFHALPVDSTTILLDKFSLQQYTSIRELAFRNVVMPTAKPGSITLFGDASFTMDSLQLVNQRTNQPQKENINASIFALQKRGGEKNTWSNLPGTAREVERIKQLFSEQSVHTNVFVQTAASEENLKAISGNSPPILHIATHGFFLPDQLIKKPANKSGGGNQFTVADDPLLRSGLLLAGANYAWTGRTPVSGVEDGIVTAYEIAQLNLSKTGLVVLSACETALGDVKGSEGVFGLQRAFKMAGVKKMIVSLWQVPDKETAELMTTFYAYWLKEKTIEAAFAQAQADMRKKYAPFYWAAFVLIE